MQVAPKSVPIIGHIEMLTTITTILESSYIHFLLALLAPVKRLWSEGFVIINLCDVSTKQYLDMITTIHKGRHSQDAI